MTNLFADLPPPDAAENFCALAELAGVRVERIVSHGHVTPDGEWYDQAWTEWVCVVEGAAELTLAEPDEIVRLKRGDCLSIAARRRHRVTWTDPGGPTIWLVVHWPPESGDAR